MKTHLKLIIAATMLAGCVMQRKDFPIIPIEGAPIRDCGHGFTVVSVRQENPPEHWEAYRTFCELYFHKTKIDEASPVFVSPSGRYAVYESDTLGGVVLYDAQQMKRFRVL